MVTLKKIELLISTAAMVLSGLLKGKKTEKVLLKRERERERERDGLFAHTCVSIGKKNKKKLGLTKKF